MKGPLLMKNVEALRLYREILRTTRFFNFPNEAGQEWTGVLRENARKEFEQARHETDPTVIARMLFVGWDCVTQTKEKFAKKIHSFEDEVDKTRTS
jgi:hypothetical protein